MALEEIHRFPNGGVRVRDSLHWDALRLWGEIRRGLALASPHEVQSAGIDTWGVDYALLDAGGHLLGNPHHYRDARTDGAIAEACRRVPREEIFAQSGVQFIQINTLYQLLATRARQPETLAAARTLLMMPDLFNYWLTGRKASEFTIATTTGFYNPRARAWATNLLARLDLPARILPEVVPPGTLLAPLDAAIASEACLPRVPVIAPACHDTASAVAATPLADANRAYISSGTWSLMGIESPRPIITSESLRNNFTNEGGIGAYRILKNIMGLWLLQACRAAWQKAGEDLSYDALVAQAEAAPALAALVDPDAERFLHPADMPAEIRAACAESGQPVPQTPGAVARCVLESLAMRYRWTFERLAEMRGAPLTAIHIVGGGSQNRPLCQWTADACGVPVIAGPVEATALGNALVQLIGAGKLSTPAEGRELVRASFAPVMYEPREGAAWDEAYARWRNNL